MEVWLLWQALADGDQDALRGILCSATYEELGEMREATATVLGQIESMIACLRAPDEPQGDCTER